MAPKKPISPPPRPASIPSDPTQEGQFLVKRVPSVVPSSPIKEGESLVKRVPTRSRPQISNLAESQAQLRKSRIALEARRFEAIARNKRTLENKFFVSQVRTFPDVFDRNSGVVLAQNFLPEGSNIRILGSFASRAQANQAMRQRNSIFGTDEKDFVVTSLRGQWTVFLGFRGPRPTPV